MHAQTLLQHNTVKYNTINTHAHTHIHTHSHIHAYIQAQMHQNKDTPNPNLSYTVINTGLIKILTKYDNKFESSTMVLDVQCERDSNMQK